MIKEIVTLGVTAYIALSLVGLGATIVATSSDIKASLYNMRTQNFNIAPEERQRLSAMYKRRAEIADMVASATPVPYMGNLIKKIVEN